jgi:CelD/BcsL family acetyltransferase involved in cellulose biosynthesis
MTAGSWDIFPRDLESIAPGVGPFPHRPFLETVWNHRDEQSGELHVEVVDDGAVALVVTDDHVEFAGQSNLTDYHAPLGSNGAEAIATALASYPEATFRFDSLPDEARIAVEAGVEIAGGRRRTADDEVSAVIALPDSYDGWLASIGKKERHEVRRKRRRFEAEFGEIEVVQHGPEAIDMFCAMHRSSQGDKGMFMTGGMQRYFEDLLEHAGATIHTLMCDGIPRANAFGFETEDGYFYYNSAYDMDAAMASPGIVLLASMIESQIARGAAVFDFLKGDERYKFKHGAQPRQLFVVTGSMP